MPARLNMMCVMHGGAPVQHLLLDVLRHALLAESLAAGLQVDPGTSSSYQPAPNGTSGNSHLGYCNASLAVYPGLPPSNTPYCQVGQPAWSAYR